MRLVIQRVAQAAVSINSKTVGSIQQGLLLLVGIEELDTQEDINWLVKKVIGMRIFSDADGKMNLSIQEIAGDILAISQFTLYASTKKGNRPSYIRAAKPEKAIPVYESFCQTLSQQLGKKIETGQFGADMAVSLVNDGPVTIVIDSKNKE